MRGSERNHYIEVQAKTTTQDSVGAERSTWTTVFSRWCAVTHDFRPTDNFVATANAQVYESKIWFITAKTRRILMTHRLMFEGNQYEILDIQDATGRNRETKILARLVKP